MSAHWQNLPLSQKLLGLSLILMVFVLPIALFSSSTTQDLRNQAAETNHPVEIYTPYVSFKASDFYVEYNGQQYFLTPEQLTYVGSSIHTPGTGDFTSIGFTWQSNSEVLKLDMFFTYTGNTWTVLYNDLTISDHSFRNQNNLIQGNLGESYTSPSLTQLYTNLLDPSKTATVVTSNLDVHPFIYQLTVPPTTTGYFVEMPPSGQPPGVINFPVSPDGGFFYTAILRDQDGNIVLDQSEFEYTWSIGDLTIASIRPENMCRYEVQAPCPDMSVSLKGLSEGRTPLLVTVTRNGQVVGSGSIDVIIGPLIFNPVSTPTPTLTPELTCTGRPVGKRADFNNSGMVDLQDYVILLTEFLETLPTYTADANCDGKVDLADYGILLFEFLK